MPRIAPAEGANVHCILDDFLWPWVDSTPVLMMRGFCPQRDILQPMGAGNRRNPPGLPPRPARLRPLGSTSERILLHSRDDRDAGPGGARRLVLVEGALSWRILWRDLALRPPTALPPEPALRSTTGIHPIEPVPVGVANGRCRAWRPVRAV